MSWEYVNFDYPVPNLFEKHLIWLSTNCHVYFAMRLNDSDNWTYYAGDASHNLLSGKILTSYGSNETNAQTNYLLTNKDSNNKVLAILPTVIQAKYIRMYIESGSSVTVYEWIPSTKLTAHEIITGDLEITDELSEAPKITITSSSIERLKIGNISGSTYGIVGYDSTSATVFELSDANQTIAGLNITNTLLQNGNDIVIDSSNKRISINSSVFGNSGVQFDYNSGTPRAYIGNGSNQYFNFDGTNISWKGVNTELSTSGKLTVSDIEADGGTVGGWILSATKLESDTTGSKIVLNQNKNRISVYNNSVEKVVMGYLNGLSKNASPSQQWGPDDYGFYALASDHLKIDGNASYVSGDWIIEDDAAYKVVDSSNNVIIKMGTDSGKKGMFIYSSLGTQLAEYSNSGITVGDVSSSQYMKYTTTDGAIFRGGLNADDITTGTLSSGRIAANSITATEIKSDTITANNINGDELGTLTITSGKIQINTTDALEVAASGNMKVVGGADIILEGDNTSPGIIQFKGSNYDIKCAMNSGGDRFAIYPDTDKLTSLYFGQDWSGATTHQYKTISSRALDQISLYVYDTANDYRGGKIDINSWSTRGEISLQTTGNNQTRSVYFTTTTNGTSCLWPSPSKTVDLGKSTYAWDNFYYDDLYNQCLFLDNIDDLSILHKMKATETLHAETNLPELSIQSLPKWMTNYNKLREEIRKENGDLISDDDFNEMICNKDELGYRYYRNFGHFVDLLAGSIRQLDNKVEDVIKRIEAIEKQ